MCIICMDYKNKYIVSGFRSDGCECPEIVYAESEDMAVRAYNQYFVDYEISGEVVCELPWHKDDEPIMMNGHKPEEVDDYLSRVTDYGGGGMYGNIDSTYVLSDLDDTETWHSVDDEYMPEDLCMKLVPAHEGYHGYTPCVLCKFDDGTLKFSSRMTINPNSDNEKIEWIEEWSKRQLKNAKSKGTCYMPAYRWKMPKEYADRVVAWRFFKEGENPNQYM